MTSLKASPTHLYRPDSLLGPKNTVLYVHIGAKYSTTFALANKRISIKTTSVFDLAFNRGRMLKPGVCRDGMS